MRFFRLKAIWFPVILLLGVSQVFAQPQYQGRPRKVDNLRKAYWVDSIYSTLTNEERIGQLFMVAAYSGGRNYNEDLITELLNAHQVGGLIFMQGGPARQAVLTNKYQHLAQVPLLIGMDGEWGLGMRLDSITHFPRQMMLGATRDTGLMYKMASAIAYQCNRMGVHINFAPDVDVNNNPANPVINSRSFGEDKRLVARMGSAYVRGLQNNGVMACAKHFPGHGNTSVDSHKDLPLINGSMAELDSVELYPFKQVISEGVKSIMVAHLEVPALENAPHIATSLSQKTITGLLKNKLHYKGLIVTDALNMKGLTKYFPTGEADLRAFLAGNDMLLYPEDVPAAILKINQAVNAGTITPERLEESVKKILAAKYDAGLAKWKDIESENIVNDLNQYTDNIKKLVAKSAVTLVSDENQILKKLNVTMRIGYVGVNTDENTPLWAALEDRFDDVSIDLLPHDAEAHDAQLLLDKMASYSSVIVGVHNVSIRPSHNYGLSDEAIAFLKVAGCLDNVMIVLMGNAYATQYFCGANSLIVGYEDDTLSQEAVADVLLKKSRARGKLPVTACAEGKSVCPSPFLLKTVLRAPSTTLRHVFPSAAGVVKPDALHHLDMFMARCIAEGVFPGCRVLAARYGNVFYDKAFGYLDYEKQHKVDSNTLYDMASCTKVLATNISVMKLYEEGKLDLNKRIVDYLPEAKGTNKANIRIKELLLHQAGLQGWIPFYKDILEKGGKIKENLFRTKEEPEYTTHVARNVYLLDSYIDTMWSQIYSSKRRNIGKMVYSDLDFIFLAEIVERITDKSLDEYVSEVFYKPMRLKNIMYNPLNSRIATNIAPTEIEKAFRASEIRGYVHDPGAAMLGGVAGHAGLFSTAHDVAAIFEMLLNKGMYGETRFLKEATVHEFTAYKSKVSHRGLGFDKPLQDADNGGPAGDRCSALAFGHQGFTGTCVWADPASGVVFVFLSNRVHPSGSNWKINKLNVRTVAQDYIYESLGIPVNKNRKEVFDIQVKD